ncbi:hypothetical protein [uncultured Campylobacter sp.]|uniref:hypothetical protein n=1 Tax=uncultured Campylobacter sp. TaxID=218934 RepID=UPI0026078427|nr:hypothetical protein [uncultured Campylobacter sp.]
MKILKLSEGFEICELKARTNNADEMSGRGVIANLWGEFLKFNASRSSATKNEIYAVYYDYENGAHGEYSVLIGTCSKEGHHKKATTKLANPQISAVKMSTMKPAKNYISKRAITRFLILRTSLRELANTGPEFGNFLKVRSFKALFKRTLKGALEDKFKFTYR